MSRFEIASNIASGFTGWLPAIRISDVPTAIQSINALSVGANPAFEVELWISSTENAAKDAPVGLWKLNPNLTAVKTTEFPTEATEGYMFDAPFIWIRPKVISNVGVLSIWGII